MFLDGEGTVHRQAKPVSAKRIWGLGHASPENLIFRLNLRPVCMHEVAIVDDSWSRMVMYVYTVLIQETKTFTMLGEVGMANE